MTEKVYDDPLMDNAVDALLKVAERSRERRGSPALVWEDFVQFQVPDFLADVKRQFDAGNDQPPYDEEDLDAFRKADRQHLG